MKMLSCIFFFHFVFVHKSVKFVGSLIAGTFLLNNSKVDIHKAGKKIK